MSYQVNVSSNEDGGIITLSKNNPEFGFIRVTQRRLVINKKGWVNMRELSALVQADVETLKSLEWSANQKLSGNIIIKESLEPFNNEYADKDLKVAGDTGIVCCLDGQPIYRKCFYDPTGNDPDTLVQHNNADEIRNVNLAAKHAEADNFEL
jgi:hypothetical protein